MNYYIVNDIDRPCERHVTVYHEASGGLKYLHPDLARWGVMGLTEYAVRVEDFGLDIVEDGDVVIFTQVRPSTVKYRLALGNVQRVWQGSNNFELSIKGLK